LRVLSDDFVLLRAGCALGHRWWSLRLLLSFGLLLDQLVSEVHVLASYRVLVDADSGQRRGNLGLIIGTDVPAVLLVTLPRAVAAALTLVLFPVLPLDELLLLLK